ncbi:hypothetical protein [Paenibacillus sp. P32E]|uniref:hypothetical protein n=1 Tax=Paenibacillus sp. P32E TaxID=1349434 RepID=UPI00093BD8E8|nr:hypothetical protein [Paenibacillus sp. P32E]OKP91408.1 hypothetical protein A3848_09900 [Paenibacillus sp. P32E]
MSVTEIELLKQQKKEIEDNIVAVNSGVKVGDPMELLNELNAVSNKISDLEYQSKLQEESAKIEAQHEERVAESSKQIAYIFDNLDFGVPTKELFINFNEEKAEASYNYVRSMLEAAITEREKISLLKIKELEEKNASLESENGKSVEKLEEFKQENKELKVELSTAKFEIEDLRAKHKAAATLLDETNKLLEQTKSWNDDLQKQIAIGASAAATVIEVKDAREQYMEQRRLEEEAKTVIYDVRWKDATHKEFLANLAATDEEITIKYFEIQGDPDKLLQLKLPQSELKSGKYRVVTAELAPSFRSEYLAKQNAEQVDTTSTGVLEVAEQFVEPTVPSFREDDSTISGLDQINTGVEMAGKTVEERLQALELAVFGKAEVEAA